MRHTIYSKYWIYSSIWGLVAAAAAVVGSLLLDNDARYDVAKSLASIAVSFSLTFVAFSVTALALLQLLQDKDWFKEIKGSPAYRSFMARFFLSIKYSLGLLVASLIAHLFMPVVQRAVLTTIMAFFLASMVFIAVWIWTCLTTFISLFRE
jgi:hypothetical protein